MNKKMTRSQRTEWAHIVSMYVVAVAMTYVHGNSMMTLYVVLLPIISAIVWACGNKSVGLPLDYGV